jgi:hypothetical protein
MAGSSIRKLALLGAASLLALVLLPGAVMAAAPEYSIGVTKSANPAAVPAAGGSVDYTIQVTNNGTGFFQVVNVADSDCTVSGPTGDDGDGKLDAGEVWSYTCTVANVVPPHTNTATVNACHDGSVGECNNDKHSAAGTASATVTAATSLPTLPPTDAISGTSGSSDSLGLVLMALAGLLASVMVLTPALARRR